jgi:hypothetical protein
MRIFMTNNLPFLDILQRVKQSKVTVLVHILDQLATSRLWGLSVWGEPERGEFSLRDQIQVLLPPLQRTKTLAHIDISYQFFIAASVGPLAEFIRTSKSLVKISIDGNDIAQVQDFYTLYTTALNTGYAIRAIQSPFIDLARIEMDPMKSADLSRRITQFQEPRIVRTDFGDGGRLG